MMIDAKISRPARTKTPVNIFTPIPKGCDINQVIPEAVLPEYQSIPINSAKIAMAMRIKRNFIIGLFFNKYLTNFYTTKWGDDWHYVVYSPEPLDVFL